MSFRTGIRHGKLGMWIFLASEVMFFSGFFTAFIILRNTNLSCFCARRVGVELAACSTQHCESYRKQSYDGNGDSFSRTW